MNFLSDLSIVGAKDTKSGGGLPLTGDNGIPGNREIAHFSISRKHTRGCG